ncbi:LysR family transcriptional regulator [Plantactinospora endophytica]|uniref:LysR family transcriptional regulator n=1 Tax=Plantactinospora endophytica TaxID=673535 RepID=A0ABQ4E0N6_9ACTN|nr:LysR substrate-binding domain-containing protein [Plantactinospora endophytica]GIG88227.1 LysR family transcriptional regulator [Plantactinospora endophytica]
MLDPWSLQVLVAVGERGSFSAAASALSLTQPAVSRQIAGLERRLGVRLFSRAARGVRPTPAGAVAIELARDSLTRLRSLEARLASFAELESGELRLAAFPSANTHFVPEAVRRFGQLHPGVTLSLRQLDQAGLLPAVRDGRIDLALVTDWHLYDEPQAARDAPAGVELPRTTMEGVELVPLLDEELQVVLPAQHRLARRRRVRLADLGDETWIDGAHPDCLGPVAPLAGALGTAPRIGFWCDDWNGKQALVAAGVGVMLMPTLAAVAVRRDVVLRPTVPVLPTRRLYAATATPAFRAPAVTAMLEVLADLAPRRT